MVNLLREKWYSTERTCGEETSRAPVDPKVWVDHCINEMNEKIVELSKKFSHLSGANYPIGGNIRDVVFPPQDIWAQWQLWAGRDVPITPDEDDTEGDGDINITANDDDEEDDRSHNAVVGYDQDDDDA